MTEPLLARPPEEGARVIALHFLDQAAAAWPRLEDESDTEALHDFRVALRRLRSSLRAYREPLKGTLPRKLLKKLRRLARSTNPGRDAEVQIAWLRGRGRHLSSYHRAGLTWLLARLESRMEAAYEEMKSELAEEFLEAEAELRRRLSVYRTEVRLDGSGHQTTLASVTAHILREHVRELEEHLARVRTVEDEEEAHEARIAAKRARYLLEPLADELPAAGPLIKRFKAFQDLLGDLHDAHVLETELAQAAEDAAAERSRRLFEMTLKGVGDERLLRAAGRRAAEAGIIALARLNRGRRDRLFQELQEEWLDGKAGSFLREVEGLAEGLEGPPQYAPTSV
jgi:CHAD domain-containing protein